MLPKLISEFLGTFFLVMTVIGSGIMGENLSQGNDAIALLANTIATGAILFVIIRSFSTISGAHFNPVVSLIMLLEGKIKLRETILFILTQIIAGLVAVIFIHIIFQLDVYQISNKDRAGLPFLLSEIVATFGLLCCILYVSKFSPENVAMTVALFISAGYWFTSSTSFANPAVTIARIFTDTFTGISPDSVVYFIPAQIIGALIALFIFRISINEK